MKLPATIKVGYRDYTVEAWEPITASANRRLGESDHFGLMIRVRADIPAQIKAEVLLHEILHCAWWVGAVEDKDDEERTVSVVANVMSQVWRDNPEFVAFMSECLSTNHTGETK